MMGVRIRWVASSAGFAGVAAAAFAIAGLGFAAQEKPGTHRFAILASVNNNGDIDVCGCKDKEVRQGSLSRRMTLVRQMRANDVPFLLVDGGSLFFSLRDNPKPFEREQWLSKARIIVEAYNAMAYDAVAVGNADLKLGLDVLLDLRKRAKFPFLSANFVDAQGEPVFEPCVVREIAGLRVGIIGLTIPVNPRYLEQFAPGCSMRDPIEAAKAAIAERNKDADLWLALSHLAEDANRDLAREVPEVAFIVDPNIVFGSHGVWITEAGRCHERVGGAAIVRTDGEGARLACIDIEVARIGAPFQTTAELLRLEKGFFMEPLPKDLVAAVGGNGNAYAVTRISVEPHILPDPTIEAWVEAFKREPGAVPTDLPREAPAVVYAGSEACKPCHEQQYDAWLGTPHARAFRALVDRGDHRRMDCIGCHTLGYGHTYIDVGEAPKWANVQCESCHGTNPKHMEDPEKNRWKPVTRSDCLVCHNKEQTRVEFPPDAFSRARCPRSTH
ncbi:MAG: hypothetical protein JXP34_12990 [Planctomycetes bacterium]|nr:hypothetical protein [Planctomycetota bacterium]